MMATLIGYKKLRGDKREREVERIAYSTTGEAKIAASGLTMIGYYDTIEVEDEEGFIRQRFVRDPKSGLYQTGF